jgi:hypothetical protein
MEPITNPAPAGEAPAGNVSQAQGSVGTAVPTGTQTPNTPAPTPSYKPEEVEKWKSEAEVAQGFRFLVEQNPDLASMVEERALGRSKYQPKVPGTDQGFTAPPQKMDPTLERVSVLESAFMQQENRRRIEENEREIQGTLKEFPFVDRAKLDEAHKKEALARYNQKIWEGIPADMAKSQALAEMRALPLKYLVHEHFKTEFQDFLVKQKTTGALPPGVNSRGDRINGGQSSYAPGFFDGKVKAFHDASGNVDRQLDVAVETAKEMGLNPEDYKVLQSVEAALRMKDSNIINGG